MRGSVAHLLLQSDRKRKRERKRCLSESILLDLLSALAWNYKRRIRNCWNSMEQSGTAWMVQKQELFSSNLCILLYSTAFFE